MVPHRRGPYTAPVRLNVRVNDEFLLCAGSAEQISTERGHEWLIRPPEVSMFHQLLAYLQAKPDRDIGPGASKIAWEGVATAAVTLRWGSYLAVLLDSDRPLWSRAKSSETSRISDGEMARINIEASAALAEWIDIYREDPCGGLYASLVEKAVTYLPMPQRQARREVGLFCDLADEAMATRLIDAAKAAAPARLERVRAAAQRHPSRVFANALVNVAWRNGPVEGVHAGAFGGYPIDQRRLSGADERTLMRFTSDRMAMGMWTCFRLSAEQPARIWPEQVLPYGLAEAMAITPLAWTLTDSSREVRLPGLEPTTSSLRR